MTPLDRKGLPAEVLAQIGSALVARTADELVVAIVSETGAQVGCVSIDACRTRLFRDPEVRGVLLRILRESGIDDRIAFPGAVLFVDEVLGVIELHAVWSRSAAA